MIKPLFLGVAVFVIVREGVEGINSLTLKNYKKL